MDKKPTQKELLAAILDEIVCLHSAVHFLVTHITGEEAQPYEPEKEGEIIPFPTQDPPDDRVPGL